MGHDHPLNSHPPNRRQDPCWAPCRCVRPPRGSPLSTKPWGSRHQQGRGGLHTPAPRIGRASDLSAAAFLLMRTCPHAHLRPRGTPCTCTSCPWGSGEGLNSEGIPWLLPDRMAFGTAPTVSALCLPRRDPHRQHLALGQGALASRSPCGSQSSDFRLQMPFCFPLMPLSDKPLFPHNGQMPPDLDPAACPQVPPLPPYQVAVPQPRGPSHRPPMDQAHCGSCSSPCLDVPRSPPCSGVRAPPHPLPKGAPLCPHLSVPTYRPTASRPSHYRHLDCFSALHLFLLFPLSTP